MPWRRYSSTRALRELFCRKWARPWSKPGWTYGVVKKPANIFPRPKSATEEDYGQEFLSLTLAVKVVKDMDEAMTHIQTYGSKHTEVIVTKDYGRAMRFLQEVDAGAVMVNASSRLNDGYQFGLGAEIGISTTRIHARGPMGLEDLTCSKYVVYGSGQLRE